MKAEDTVMDDNDASWAYENARKAYEEVCEVEGKTIKITEADKAGINGHSLAQAKISFKAGYEQHKLELDKAMLILEQEIQEKVDEERLAGIKEVVEWIMSHQDGVMVGQDVQAAAGNNCKYGDTSHLLIRWLNWQSKLKEWGVE